MAGLLVEVEKNFQQLVNEFNIFIKNQGPIKAELLDNGRITSTEITYLPDGMVVFEKHAPHLGFPYYFSVGPDGAFLDRQKTKPAEAELLLSLESQRMYDPRLIAQVMTAEEHYPMGQSCINFDVKQFSGWSSAMKELLQAAPPKPGTAFYAVNKDRLYHLTMQEGGESLTLKFIYPEENLSQSEIASS